MSEALMQVSPAQTAMEKMIKSEANRIEALVPQGFPGGPAGLTRLLCAAVYKNPQLAECTPESFLIAAFQCADLGLMPNTPMQEIHLIPFFEHGVRKVQVIPGYPGLIKAAVRDGTVKSIWATTVMKKDRFVSMRVNGEYRIEHEPYLGDDSPGGVRCIYAAAVLNDGTLAEPIIIPARDFSALKARFTRKRKDGSVVDTPWTSKYESDFHEMIKKTAIRRLCKTLPKSNQFSKVLALQAANEANADTSMLGYGEHFRDDVPVDDTPAEDAPPAPSNFAAVKARIPTKPKPAPEPAPVMDAEFTVEHDAETGEVPDEAAPPVEYWTEENVTEWEGEFERCGDKFALTKITNALKTEKQTHPIPDHVNARLTAAYRKAKVRVESAPKPNPHPSDLEQEPAKAHRPNDEVAQGNIFGGAE